MIPPLEDLKATLERLLPGIGVSVEAGALLVEPKDVPAVFRCLKENEKFHMDYLANVTAVDYPPERIEVVYHLYSMARKHGPLLLKVKLPRANPVVASVTPIWRAAELQQREVFDLYGVTFQGHPDLRRILMWDGFAGHPMRKDYVPEDQDAPA